MRKTFLSGMLDRGVWQAPWIGPDGELVLIGITKDHRMIAPPHVVPHGASRIEAAEAIAGLLEREDPVPMLRII